MKVDLHIHTTASDGSWTPEQLISEVRQAGIRLFSVTDHDTVKNVPTAAKLAAAAGIFFLSGVEVCSTVRGQCFHILGYGIDPANRILLSLLEHNTQLMEETDENSIRKLIEDGLPLNYEEYRAYEHNPARGGWKSLSFLIDKGLCQDVGGFFRNLFTAERGISFPAFPPPADVIGAIKAAGGVAVLAHPGSGFHGMALEATLDYFAREAIQGVECFHPSHDQVITNRACAWCDRYGLLITGGSDCHGDFVPERRLGFPELTLEQLRLGDLCQKSGC